MQKICALIFAFTLGCVAADYTINPAGWVKQPVRVLEDTDYSFTNLTTLLLSTVNSTTDLNVIAYTQSESDSSSASWQLSTKAITANDLSPSSVASYEFTSSEMTPWFSRGYAFGIDCSNIPPYIPQCYLYQTKLDGTVLPRVQLTSNTNFYQIPITNSITIGNNIVIFINYGQTMNFTSYNIETSTLGEEFTLITYNTMQLSLAWGKALSDSQVSVAWKVGDYYRFSIVDFSTGIVSNPQLVAGEYQKNMLCVPYVTDLTLYGVWCRNETYDGSTINLTVLVSSADLTLRKLFTVVNVSDYDSIESFPYGGNLGFIHYNSILPNTTTISKEIWDLEANKPLVNKTAIMTIDLYLSGQFHLRIPGVGTYQLIYNFNNSNMKSNVVLGQILDEPASEKVNISDSYIGDFLPLL